MPIGANISIINLNVNGINAPTKRHRLAEWIQNQDPHICCLQETQFRSRDTYILKVRGWKKVFTANWKKVGVAILISDKIGLSKEYYKRYGRILHNDQRNNPRRTVTTLLNCCKFTIVNIYVPNIGASQYIGQY